MEWVEKPKLRPIFYEPEVDPDKTLVRVRIEVQEVGELGVPTRLGPSPSYTHDLERSSVPPEILQAHEDHRNTPDISGRKFQVLVCQNPEFKESWLIKPGEVAKNAWIMRDEFLSLDADPLSGWIWSVRQFLNKWGLWGVGQEHVEGWPPSSSMGMARLLAFLPQVDRPRLVMLIPHQLKEQQEKYGKALLPSNARNWLRSHPLNLDTADEFPFFLVRRSYCTDAIEATITIDHLANRQFGICRRCHGVFEKETRHKKSYCSERCFNAAGVQRWREKQRKTAKKGAKRNAKG